ncbi:TetR/AcrR family transcriptional regulator (plasmid) [Coraliomargarita sp. W4R53]
MTTPMSTVWTYALLTTLEWRTDHRYQPARKAAIAVAQTNDSATKKPRLDRETIIAAALELAATPGVSTVSFRDLGAQLGVDPTAVYRHFRSKDELTGVLVEELTIRGLAHITAAPEEWKERLRQLAQGALAEFVRYPAIGVEAIAITTHGTQELRAIEIMLDAFSRAGLDGDELVRHYALLALHILASSSNMARAYIARGTSADDGDSWLDEPLLADPREFPLTASLSTKLTELRDTELFAAGVELVIESAERSAAS